MLVLSRSRSEKIVFPGLGITIEILRVAGNRVHVGIDAPKEIQILRSEVLESSNFGMLSSSQERASAK